VQLANQKKVGYSPQDFKSRMYGKYYVETIVGKALHMQYVLEHAPFPKAAFTLFFTILIIV